MLKQIRTGVILLYSMETEPIFVNKPSVTSTFLVKNMTPESVAALCATPVSKSVFGRGFYAFGAQWCIKIYFGGCKEKYKGSISAFIYLVTRDETKTVEFKLSIGKAKCNKEITCFSTLNPPPEGSVSNRGNNILLRHADLLANPADYIIDGVLSLTATLSDPVPHLEFPTNTVAVPPSSLGGDLLAILRSGSGADVTLVCKGEQIKAHSLILSHRSSFFAALLDQSSPMACADVSAIPVLDSITPAILLRIPDSRQRRLHAYSGGPAQRRDAQAQIASLLIAQRQRGVGNRGLGALGAVEARPPRRRRTHSRVGRASGGRC